MFVRSYNINILFGEIAIVLIKMYAPAVLGQDFEQMTIPAQGTYGSMKGMGDRNLYAVDFQTNSEILHEFLYGGEDSAVEVGE